MDIKVIPPPVPVPPSQVVLTLTMLEAKQLIGICNAASVHPRLGISMHASNLYHALHRAGVTLRD